MESIGKFIDRLQNMDQGQRLQIARFAALAAAAGPVILIFGRLATGLGKLTGWLGTFCTAVGKAGGADTNPGGAGQKTALKSAEESFAFLSRQVYPGFTAALIHSRVEEGEQSRILSDFRAGRIQILVATSVVEVGVDVPNATCMVIEQADRFGLAALHQLRGRVGRGQAQSYCFLVYSKNLTETGVARMKILRESNDGFKIAEEDLRLRGPGEITGTAQSGELAFAIADLARDKDLLLQARSDAFSREQLSHEKKCL